MYERCTKLQTKRVNVIIPTMKAQILKTLAALALITTSAPAHETPMENHTASYIAMPAAEGQTEAFAEFLAGAAPIVADTEPRTKLTSVAPA